MRFLLPVTCLAVLLPQLALSSNVSAADLDYEYAAPAIAAPLYERREVLPPPPVTYEVPVRPYYRPHPRFYPTYYPRPYGFHRPFVRPYGFEGYGYRREGYRRFGYGY